MVRHDLALAMARPSPVPFPEGLVVKKGSRILAAESGAIPEPSSMTQNDTRPLSASTRLSSTWPPSSQASHALRSRVGESVLEETRFAATIGGSDSGDPGSQLHACPLEAMLHEVDGLGGDGLGGDVFERKRVAAREREKAADDARDALTLFEDRAHRPLRPFVVFDLAGRRLLGAPHDHTERRRDFVGDPGRQRPHGGEFVGAHQALVSLSLDLADGELALELELFSLLAKGHASEGEDQPSGERYPQDEAGLRAQLPCRARVARS